MPRPNFEMGIDSRMLYDRLKLAEVGEVVEYDEMSKIIDRPVQGDGRGSLNTARKAASRDDGIIFGTIRKVGLKRLSDAEIVGKQDQRRRHVKKTAESGFNELGRIQSYEKLSAQDKVRHNATASIFAAVSHVTKPSSMKRIEIKVAEAQAKLPIASTLKLFE